MKDPSGLGAGPDAPAPHPDPPAPGLDVDLRSDTVTRPTAAMREAMLRAPVGDDCFGEDPTVRRLEARVAELLGKERSLFFPSGIMANQTGILALGEAGTEVILDAHAHLVQYEEASVAKHGGMMLRGVASEDGILTAEALEAAFHPPSPFQPRASVVAFENTHLDSGGRVQPPDTMMEAADLARSRGARVHLDGARLWNAASALGVTSAEVASPADTVMTCLSKGLGAPVGSMLAGPAKVLDRAWRIRRRLGGQMRQAGILAAGGLHALDHHLDRIGEDHERAKRLAEAVAFLPGVQLQAPETNIVMIDVSGTGRSPPDLVEALAREGVGVVPFGATRIRAVLHLEVDDAGVDRAIEALSSVLRG